MPCEIISQPSPGSYKDTIFVRLDNKKAKSIFYSFGPDVKNIGSWISKSSAPLPERSNSVVVATQDGYNLIGGLAGNTPLFLNDRYDKKTDSWICDVDSPVPLDNHASAFNMIVGGNTSLEWDDSKKVWRNICSIPENIRDHNFVGSGNSAFLLNGTSKDIFEYSKEKNTWRVVGPNRFSSKQTAATNIKEKIFFSSKENGIIEFNSGTESLTWTIDYKYLKGASIVCGHPYHFKIVGGHDKSISSDVSFVDTEARSIRTEPAAPAPGAYMASNSHSTICGIGRSNAFYQHKCVFDWQYYKEPIKLFKNGPHTIYAVAFDDKMNVLDHRSFEFNMESRYVSMILRLSSNYDTVVEWPGYIKEDEGKFSIADIIPEGCTIELSHNNGPMRAYNRELIETYGSLNKTLISGDYYKIRIADPTPYEKGLRISGYVSLQNSKEIQ